MSKIFGLDAGHCTSGADTGAQGNGYKEQDLTRQVVTYLSEYLENEGHITKYCHCHSASSVNESLRYRVNKANSLGVDYFVSIHLNAGGGVGTETYICARGGEAERVAKRVNSKLVQYGYRDRGVKVGNLYVIKNTNAPAILVECCFIDSASDMAKFNAKSIAKAIAEGLLNKTIGEVNKPESKPNNSDSSKTYYRVVVGSYTDRANAVKKQEELKSKGEESFLLAYKE
ncbi:N-acetylmuramoyl-L-alanine amidase [Clostridium perfringens]|uniref:N-acetylmuramoyl-L-alanine amidase n=1 Tax=Clostridium perfringens TaxID=1502 RepID=A0AAP4A641_CLOPF|nr:N-acetylmuramoyl-L-alanine amidase [Clostridium perfringens]MDH2335653.1 N-acetylmuramoyl-L-alanine amidase [Clostridium perfringens]MDK0862799.1 N-acetylmuramoyl-L-alanine amidase [Clostridium perfringens]MDM0465543.1 N-acetylmuramoyl-L-alanine amidase [Clostridium perfringens]